MQNMMKTTLLTLCLLAGQWCLARQSSSDSLYAPEHLKADLAFVQHQLRQVHANPYSILTEKQFDRLFDRIAAQLNQPLTAAQFHQLIKPVIDKLGDEHAYVGPLQPVVEQPGKTNCPERVGYQAYGNTGYLNACSFDTKPTGPYSMAVIQARIDSIFQLLQATGIRRLIIDVSNNEGGNSAVGDYLIACISDKPYKDYQCNWKRSLEYQKLYESWGLKNELYANTPIGNVLHFAPDTVQPVKVPYPFSGKVLVLVGKATFSSAMQFATLVKDNGIAPLAGQIPAYGHPSGFGELFNTRLPNTGFELRFGVKEWIRPAGKRKGDDNLLHPDITLTTADMQDVHQVIRKTKMGL